MVAGEYVGLDVHRTARICAVAYGGQILLSLTTSTLIEDGPPPGVGLRSLGQHRLRDLQQPERIFQVLHPDLPNEFPPLRSLDAFPNNLPRQLTSFIGREREIAEVKRLSSTTYLLMLTGSGGCGKTRLALQVAADLIDVYADGVWLVELAARAEPELVPQAVASALGLREVPGRPLQAILLDYLRTREVLLVLDNCEHLVTACAELAEALMRSCSRIRILATSREPLGVRGETVWRVPSLSLPEPRQMPSAEHLMQYEAIRLFIERATAVQPTFTLTLQNAGIVATVCRRLDGIPLAIELAAARMRALSLEQIAARLDERFTLLTGGSRTALPRQQTLRGTLDWSYDLLSHKERALLRRLSVFAGGWTLEAAEVVCSDDGVEAQDILDLLTQLVFKSLVLMDAQEGDVRYGLLETVRQYGRSKLDESGEAASVRTRHLNWYLRLAERAEPELIGADQSLWLDRLGVEHDNLRAALEWSKVEESDGESGLRLARALWQFWYVRGYFSEGRGWLEAMLSHSRDASASVRARALAAAGFLACRQGDYDGSIRLSTESLALFRELGDLSGMGQALYALGMVAESQSDYERAKTLFIESLTMGRQVGEKRRMAVSLNSIGEVARCQDNYEAARASYEESLSLMREVKDKRGIAITLGNLGHVALYQGDNERAAKIFREALGLARQLVFKLGIAEYLAGLGGVAATEGRHQRAARLLGIAEEVLSLLGALLRPPDRAEYERSITATHAGLNDAAFAAAWAEGKAMTLDHAIEYALSTQAFNSFRHGEPEDRTGRPSSNGLL
jgi:predicted ATPase